MQKLICVIAVAGLATAAHATPPPSHEARQFCGQNLLAGGSVDFPFALQPGEVVGFMTMPTANFGTNFASPDTIAEIRDSANTLIGSNDDAGTDGRGGVPVGPARGSLVRYGVTTADTYNFRVRGFDVTQAGGFSATYVRFTPGGSSDFTDNETNDTVATAQALAVAAGSATVGFGSLTTGDLDVFAISVSAGDVISAFTIPLNSVTAATPGFDSVDTRLDIRAADGSIIISNDDAGSDFFGVAATTPGDFGSGLRYEVTTSGTLYLSVRGFDSSEVGDYALAVGICNIPAPGAAGALALGGLTLLRRRRR
jgi:hypothetical protein